MLHEEDVKREIAQRSRTVCNEAIELERFDAKYKELSKKFDLKKLDKYPEDDRRKILEAVSLPIDGPHSVTERMRLLQFFDKYPYQYR